MKKIGFRRLTTQTITRDGSGNLIGVEFTIFEESVWIDDEEGEFDAKLYEKVTAEEIYKHKLANGFEVDR